MFFDLALNYEPSHGCDLMLDENGDFSVDDTPITPMLLAIELDQRAATDDPLPETRDRFSDNSFIDERRGSPCDCFGHEPIGSKCWLLSRAKQNEETRLLFKMWLEDALNWVQRETGLLPKISVEWLRPQTLRWRVEVDGYSLSRARGIN